MDSLNYILFICMAVPIGLCLFLLEGKVRQTMVYVLIGICCCMFVSEINGLILNHFDHNMFHVTTVYTPITEELIKAIPVLFFAYAISSKKSRLLNISLATGIGFALLENIIILIDDIESVTIWWALGRGFASSLMHALCTAAVGYGMSFITQRRKLAISGTFSLLLLAITVHAIFNCLVQSDYPVLGLLLPVVNYIPLIIIQFRIRRKGKQKPLPESGEQIPEEQASE